MSVFLSGLSATSVQNFLSPLHSVDQEDIKVVKQPKAFIWGLRDCNLERTQGGQTPKLHSEFQAESAGF